jgi:transposase InsO family protein
VNECSLPRKRDVEQGARLVIKQSTTWNWTHQPAEEKGLSPAARGRLRMLQWHEQHGRNVSTTCRHHGTSRPTFYRWQARYQTRGLRGLEERSHRPRHVCPPTWTTEQVLAVLALREQYPRWGKAKLQRLLVGQGIALSVSMVGRILRHLKATGQLREGTRNGGRTVHRPRPYAVRKPKDYVVAVPGDLVQVDTKDLRFGNGSIFKHLSLVDVTSRYATAEVGVGATAATITTYLDRMRARLPFVIRAIQVDGGSEFKAEFETYCRDHDLRLFVLPPRSPKLNGRVERIQRTFDEECYQCFAGPLRVADLAAALREYETVYNTIRPHQALDYQTPQEVLDQQKEAA